MGYNNNNAGMHFVRYNHYAEYEDLKYYDDLAAGEKPSFFEDNDKTKYRKYFDDLYDDEFKSNKKSVILTGKSKYSGTKMGEKEPLKESCFILEKELSRRISSGDMFDTSRYIVSTIFATAILKNIDILSLLDDEEEYMKQYRKIGPEKSRYYLMNTKYYKYMGKPYLALDYIGKKLGIDVEYMLEDHVQLRLAAIDKVMSSLNKDMTWQYDVGVNEEYLSFNIYDDFYAHEKAVCFQNDNFQIDFIRDTSYGIPEYSFQVGKFRGYDINKYYIDKMACLCEDARKNCKLSRLFSKIKKTAEKY